MSKTAISLLLLAFICTSVLTVPQKLQEQSAGLTGSSLVAFARLHNKANSAVSSASGSELMAAYPRVRKVYRLMIAFRSKGKDSAKLRRIRRTLKRKRSNYRKKFGIKRIYFINIDKSHRVRKMLKKQGMKTSLYASIFHGKRRSAHLNIEKLTKKNFEEWVKVEIKLANNRHKERQIIKNLAPNSSQVNKHGDQLPTKKARKHGKKLRKGRMARKLRRDRKARKHGKKLRKARKHGKKGKGGKVSNKDDDDSADEGAVEALLRDN